MTAYVDINKYKQLVIDDFNSRPNYDEGNQFHLSLANRLIEIAQPQPGQQILDIATGTGLVAIPAAQIVGSSGRVVGVDIAKGMLEQAQRKIETLKLKNVELIEADADHLNFNDSSFDIIFCSSALVYLTDIQNSLQQWHRFLKPGGLVAFSCFAETAHTAAVMFRKKAQTYGILIPNPNEPLGTPQKCQDLLKDIGFQDIKVITEQFGSYLSNVEGAWNGNARSAFGAQVKELPPERLEQLKAEYIAAVEATATDKGIWNDVTTFFVLGSK
ncbi:class I SAM-dependent methyltransferase [Gloeocapsopsis dulcis]|uniref:Methyltransferase type 11 n=1 Tax=Gloeocapsopsis dulcis AAB1 = 1H9 TaxID=1433147 RepID=A0A6N8FXC0_9CHRO|nr:methyltransferase domain-containing protein [Gloeocapsopsis dulcis]MUL37770.1 methyltransferase type 11 [Gloeocapsopsis dulcis AAB1 = 1H9]WNN90610.1 class I SAM-dependent methyltransferase [Gloeocapsopsis dulcis]